VSRSTVQQFILILILSLFSFGPSFFSGSWCDLHFIPLPPSQFSLSWRSDDPGRELERAHVLCGILRRRGQHRGYAEDSAHCSDWYGFFFFFFFFFFLGVGVVFFFAGLPINFGL
jgi:hypothetical protein